MKFDGKALAETIYADLLRRVEELQKQSVTPTLAVILIGDDPGSVSYVAQKEKHAKRLGITLHIDRLPTTVTEKDITAIADAYNADPDIHGIIIQRPTPVQITKAFLDAIIIPEKDIDGFHPDSDFAAPVALAVERILYEIYKVEETKGTKGAQDAKGAQGTDGTQDPSDPSVPSAPFDPSVASVSHLSFATFAEWLLLQDIVVMGKGETAGSPIISHFHGRNALVTVIDSQTEHSAEILAEANIIITAVGKPDILPPGIILRDKIIIGVGLHTEDGKLRGDYREHEVADSASFYTPTPGGVGPVNVAMLMNNVVRAAEEQKLGI